MQSVPCVCACVVCVSVCVSVCVCVRVCVTVRGGESLFASVWRRSPNAVQCTVLESNAVQYTVLERRHFPRASLGITHDGCIVSFAHIVPPRARDSIGKGLQRPAGIGTFERNTNEMELRWRFAGSNVTRAPIRLRGCTIEFKAPMRRSKSLGTRCGAQRRR